MLRDPFCAHGGRADTRQGPEARASAVLPHKSEHTMFLKRERDRQTEREREREVCTDPVVILLGEQGEDEGRGRRGVMGRRYTVPHTRRECSMVAEDAVEQTALCASTASESVQQSALLWGRATSSIRALYGLRCSARAWGRLLNSILSDLGMTQSEIDHFQAQGWTRDGPHKSGAQTDEN